MAKRLISLTVNGRKVQGDVEDRMLLVHFLRENLRLTGTHVGCDTSHCGACTVDMNGKSVKSCTVWPSRPMAGTCAPSRAWLRPTARCIRCRKASAWSMAFNAASAPPA